MVFWKRDTSAPDKPTLIPQIVANHFHPEPVQNLTITQRTWPYRVRVDLQRAIDHILSTMEVAHFSSARKEYSHSGLSLHEVMMHSEHDNAVVVPTVFEEIDIGEESPARCLKNALWLVRERNNSRCPMAVLMAPSEVYGHVAGIKFEVAVPTGGDSVRVVEAFYRDLERAVLESKTYRGKVLSLEHHEHYRGQSTGILVHRLRTVSREQVILPHKTLDLLDRNVLHFVQQRQQLSRLKMQTKKGLLFYGPPGTGKTHTIHYLASALPGHTTLLITAEQIGLLSEFITLARLLQPSLVVIEDADLIARNRERMQSACEEVALNRLLNEMDGLREDADVIFILTTNRPEMLEPALAARPGRIDQAIEFPLPDTIGREKLIKLYSRDARIDDATIQSIVRKTEGVSAAFIKELMRRAAQFAIERAADVSLELLDIDHALEEMLFAGGSLNRKLLGGVIHESTSNVQ